MQGTVLGARDAAITSTIVSALMGPHSKIQTFTGLIYATKEKKQGAKRACNRELFWFEGSVSLLSGNNS